MAQSKEQTPVSKGSFKTIVLCGSTKFKKHFIALNLVLTLSNWIVLSVGSFHHIDHEIKEITMARKKQLDDLHKAKIDISCSEPQILFSPETIAVKKSEANENGIVSKHIKICFQRSEEEE